MLTKAKLEAPPPWDLAGLRAIFPNGLQRTEKEPCNPVVSIAGRLERESRTTGGKIPPSRYESDVATLSGRPIVMAVTIHLEFGRL